MEPQKAEEGEFRDLEGLDLTSKLDLLRKNEQWKCQVKKEALEVRFGGWFLVVGVMLKFFSRFGTEGFRENEKWKRRACESETIR